MVTYQIIQWLVVLIGIGIAGFPICFSMMRYLPDKGLAFSRIAFLVLFGFFYWLACSLGIIGNNAGGILIIFLPLFIFSVFLWVKNFSELYEWIRINRSYLLIEEAVFLLAFSLIIVFRLANPNIAGTEKPMEMTFINGIVYSETFPPHDSWLAGYSISYYYFGYVMTMLIGRLAGVPAEVSFNLMLATVFALAAAASYSLVNNLLSVARNNGFGKLKHFAGSFLAPIFLLICSNLEGLLEVFYARGLFWKTDGSSAFWQWLGLKELDTAPAIAPTWDITQRPGIWWWRASRVLSDTGLDGSSKEIIDEFPFFSFYLGDLHPHVLGIPFVLLALALALNAYWGYRNNGIRVSYQDQISWDKKILSVGRNFLSQTFWFDAICIGGLLFMNTWDFPIYFVIYCGVYGLAAYQETGKLKKAFCAFLEKGIPFGIACVFLYFSFLSGLSSQAGGFIPSGVFTTRTIQFVIMFGLFLIPIIWWLVRTVGKSHEELLRKTLKISIILFAVFFLLETIIFVGLAWFNQSGSELQSSGNKILSQLGAGMMLAGSAYAGVQGFQSMSTAITGYFSRRLQNLPLMFLIFGSLAFILVVLFSKQTNDDNDRITDEIVLSDEKKWADSSDRFVSLMLFLGFGLILIPEFFYLRDFFGTRMNTIFKFYYQVWILFAIASAYACSRIFEKLSSRKKWLIALPMFFVTAACLIYPFQGITDNLEIVHRKVNETPSELTLDGSQFLKVSRPDDWAGIDWLKKAKPGVIVEKVGASYTSDNAVSTFSGHPTILGPTNHESQWRGGYKEIGTREADVQTIYESRNWTTVKKLLQGYQVRYIFIGSAEQTAYKIQEQKFRDNLETVFQSGNCRIYQVY